MALGVARDARVGLLVVLLSLSGFFVSLGALLVGYAFSIALNSEMDVSSLLNLPLLAGQLVGRDEMLVGAFAWHWPFILLVHGGFFGWFAAQITERWRWSADVVVSCYAVYGAGILLFGTPLTRAVLVLVGLGAALASAKLVASKLELAEISFTTRGT
jgi:hypothetical protein